MINNLFGTMQRLYFLLVFVLVQNTFVFSDACAVQKKTRPVVVGLRMEPPFVIKDTDGSYYGLSVDLWKKIAEEYKWEYRFVELNGEVGIVNALVRRRIDVCINPLHVSGTRVRQMSVTQPFFISSLGVAAHRYRSDYVSTFFSSITSPDFLKLLLTLFLVVTSFGMVVWFIERRHNKNHFRPGTSGMLLDGIWWATVTTTTVGYGDKIPKTALGRIVSMVWMFFSISLVSSFTATITSTLTVNNLGQGIESVSDLQEVGVIGVVKYSPAERYLSNHNIEADVKFAHIEEALVALKDEEITALVHDKATMEYFGNRLSLEQQVRVMPITFNKQYFSFIMPKKSRLLEQINPVLVDKINTDSWQAILTKYNLNDKRE